MSPATTTYERLVAERPPKAIHIEQEYHDWQRTLSRFLAKPDDQLSDAEAAYAETIALLIEAYEKNRYPLPAATPACSTRLSAWGFRCSTFSCRYQRSPTRCPAHLTKGRSAPPSCSSEQTKEPWRDRR